MEMLNLRRKFVTTAALLLSTLAFYGCNAEANSSAESESFRGVLLDYDAALNSCANVSGASPTRLNQLILSLTPEQLVEFKSYLPNADAFSTAVNQLVDACFSYPSSKPVPVQSRMSMSAAVFEGDIITTGFPPDYPAGTGYDVFTATLEGFGLLDYGDENRTDANGVAVAWTTISALRIASATAQTACDSAPSGDLNVANAVACPLALIAKLAEIANQIVLDQTTFQDGLIDGAEIEATYENSKYLLENTVKISNDIVAHDLAISEQLTQHDEDVKAKLDLLNGKLDVLLERQLEILRLLHTPQGQRQTDVPACDNAPCDFPDNP